MFILTVIQTNVKLFLNDLNLELQYLSDDGKIIYNARLKNIEQIMDDHLILS